MGRGRQCSSTPNTPQNTYKMLVFPLFDSCSQTDERIDRLMQINGRTKPLIELRVRKEKVVMKRGATEAAVEMKIVSLYAFLKV